MRKDPIIEELRAIRDAHAKTFKYDLTAIVADLRREQVEEDRPVVSFPPRKRIRRSKAA